MNIILDACPVIAFVRNETGADLVRETITNQNNNKINLFYLALRLQFDKAHL